MTRKEFIDQVGVGVAAILIPGCMGGLSSCSNAATIPAAPTNIDFTLDVSTGALSKNGGYLVSNGIVVARTAAGGFLAVSAACTHQGTTVQYISANNYFYCADHGATFSASGQVTGGPANRALTSYSTTLTGTSLRVYS
jgi:cytochrome b6-f complex iron-sulfur subunit